MALLGPLFRVLAALCLVSPALAADLESVFEAHQATGTLVIERLGDGKRWVHDPARADRRHIPASTFKIANTIFALETGVVADVDEIIPWDGKVHRIKSWNRSLSLRDAIKVSAVPIYQHVARQIGLDRMAGLLAKLGYGNALTGSQVDLFWLRGPLRISANEQIAFLKRLNRRDLPFSRDAQEATIEIMEDMRGENRVLRAKTGWEIASNPDIGWYVGWLESQDDVWIFALNIDVTKKAHRAARSDIVIAALGEVTGRTLSDMRRPQP